MSANASVNGVSVVSRWLCGLSAALAFSAAGASSTSGASFRPPAHVQGRAAGMYRCPSVSAISLAVKERYSHHVGVPVEHGWTCAYISRASQSRQIGVTFVTAPNTRLTPEPYNFITVAYATAQVQQGNPENPPPRPPISASELNEPGTVAKWLHGVGFLVVGAHETGIQLKAVLALAIRVR
jgi:hypothetical protein